MSRLALQSCSSREDLRRAKAFRESLFLSRRGLVFDGDEEDRRDAESFVFLLLDGDEPVATARCQPHPSPLSVLCAVDAQVAWGADSEVGRVAAVPAPAQRGLSLYALALGALWLMDNTSHQRYVAHCHPALLRIYRLLGAEETGVVIRLPGRDEDHSVVVGGYADCVGRGLRLLGLPLGEARDLLAAPSQGPFSAGARSA